MLVVSCHIFLLLKINVIVGSAVSLYYRCPAKIFHHLWSNRVPFFCFWGSLVTSLQSYPCYFSTRSLFSPTVLWDHLLTLWCHYKTYMSLVDENISMVRLISMWYSFISNLCLHVMCYAYTYWEVWYWHKYLTFPHGHDSGNYYLGGNLSMSL